jgi:hypothetical protein
MSQSPFTGLALATINGQTTQFEAHHRMDNPTPAAFEVSFTVPVSFEDIVAAVWVMGNIYGGELNDFTDDPADTFSIHTVVTAMLFNHNNEVGDAHAAIARVQPGTDLAEFLDQVRARVAAAYGLPVGPVPAARPSRRGRGRVAPGVVGGE